VYLIQRFVVATPNRRNAAAVLDLGRAVAAIALARTA
jgi:hypothetical protein